MKKLLIKEKRTLSTISGILLGGLILNSFTSHIPVSYVEANEPSEIGNLSISTSREIEENMIIKEYIVDHTPTYIPDAKKVKKIKKYLAGRNAPLAEYAEEFVKAADHYNIDYRIVAAISVIESGGGKHTFRAHNAWGWGKNSFENWSDGIWTVSKGISKYYSRGLTTPQLIAPYYCPPNPTRWAQNVTFIMSQIGD